MGELDRTKIGLIVLVLSVFLSPVIGLEAQNEDIFAGTLVNNDVTDTRTDDGITKDIQEENIGSGGPNADYQLNTSELFVNSEEGEITKLTFITNSFTDGESFQVVLVNKSSGSFVDTGIRVDAISDGTTYEASVCDSNCDISGNPNDFINSNGEITAYFQDTIAGEGKSKDVGSILSIDYQNVNLTFDSTPPTYNDQVQNSSAITSGETVNLSVETQDNINISSAILETNESGVFENKSVYGSPKSFQESTQTVLSDFIWQNSSIDNSIVSWRVYLNDTTGNYNQTPLKSFGVDSEPPNITILKPENQTLANSTPELSVAVDEDNVSLSYRVDGGPEKDFSGNTTLNELSEGSHKINVTAQDEAGNTGMKQRFFTVDTVPPGFNSIEEIPGNPVYLEGQKYRFNVTLEDQNPNEAILEFEDSNYSADQVSGKEYSVALEDLSAGNYSYRWYGNDTAGNYNKTPLKDYEVEKAYLNTTLRLNSTYGDRAYNANTTSNLSVGLNKSEDISLFTNFSGSLNEVASGKPILEYLRDLDFGIGTFLVRGVFYGTENYSAENQSFNLEVIDEEPPSVLEKSDSKDGRAFKGDEVEFRAKWEDNVKLSGSKLSVNTSGEYSNVSEKLFDNQYSNFTYEYPLDRSPGVLGWKQWANDTSGNFNSFNSAETQVYWGYSESDLSLSDNSIQIGDSVEARCRVTDSNSSSALNNYGVELYNDGSLVEEGFTGSEGWFNTTFSPQSTQDDTHVECAIYQNQTKNYEASENGTAPLAVNEGAPPKLKDNRYGLNTTDIIVGESLKAYAQWNDTLNYSYIEYETGLREEYENVTKKSPFTNNYTNFTIKSETGWYKGQHSAKIYANDSKGNLNNTLERISFDVRGYSDIKFTSPVNNASRGNTRIYAEITDSNTSEALDNYTVKFWRSGNLIGENTTNSSGIATYNWDTSGLDLGEKNLKANITNSEYYIASKSEDQNSFNLTGFLKPDILKPEGIVNRNTNQEMESTTLNGEGSEVSVDSAEWFNSSGEIVFSGSQGLWNISEDYDLGPETLKFEVDKDLYEKNFTETDITVYGFSRIEEAEFEKGKINEGELNTIKCRVGEKSSSEIIEEYEVKFYNSTELIGTSQTNSTGWAETDFEDNSPGIETFECEIQDDKDLYYNLSTPSVSNLTLETVDTTKPNLTVDTPESGFEGFKREKLYFNLSISDNFNLSTARLELNDTGVFENQIFNIQGEDDSINYSFENTSFEGELGYQAFVNDTYGNTNSTVEKTATIYGGSELSEISAEPDRLAPGNTVNVICRVRDNLTASGLENYNVELYNETGIVDQGLTNSTGYSQLEYAQDETGSQDLRCEINDNLSIYYKADVNSLEETVDFQFGNQIENASSLEFNGGFIEGSRENLNARDSNTLNWKSVNASLPQEKLIKLNTSTEIPPGTFTSIDYIWDLSSKIHNHATAVNDPGGSGIISLSNGNIDSTHFHDTEAANLTEEAQGNSQEFIKKGFNFRLPEDESEVVPDRLEYSAEVKTYNKDGSEQLRSDFSNFATGGYESCDLYNNQGAQNFTCEITDQATISEVIDGDLVRVEFNDTLRTNGEVQTTWEIDHQSVNAEYQNPETGNTYEYSVGSKNVSNGNLQKIGSINPNGSISNYTLSTGSKDYVNPQGNITSYLSVYENNTPSNQAFREVYSELDRFNLQVNYDVEQVADYSTKIKDTQGKSLSDVSYKISDSGEIIDRFDSSGQNFTDKLEKGKKYEFVQSISTKHGDHNVTFRNFSLEESVTPETRLINYSNLEQISNIENVSRLYGVKQEGFSFDTATIKLPKTSTPNVILHCRDYDFSNDQCNNWEVNETSDYPSTETENYFKFNVTSFSVFGTGQGEPLPNVTNIRIYNVSEAQNIREDGKLLESGLNQTFAIDQKNSETKYRFEFDIVNEGTVDWNIKPADVLNHTGINDTWQKEDAYYNISGNIFEGGTINDRTLEWHTSNGGTLTKGEEMSASYVVNTSTKSSNFYEMDFLVNDTSDNSGSQDFHELNKTKYGFLNITVQSPPESFSAQKNEVFDFNTTVICEEGVCGSTNISARYNQSEQPDTLIPTNEDKPFYIIGNENTFECGKLRNNEECNKSWDINASGNTNSVHLIDTVSKSDLANITKNNSKNREVTIVESVIFNLEWDNVDFGAIKPGEKDNPAQGNYDRDYNITVPENSKKVDRIEISASPLNNSRPDNYFINAENMSFNRENNTATQTQLSNESKILEENIDPDTTFSTYYWIDIPDGLKADDYSGVIFFEAYE